MNNEYPENINYPEPIEKHYIINVPPGQAPERLDSYITRSIKAITRSKVQNAIDNDCVKVNGLPAKASKKIKGNDVIECKVFRLPPIELIPENIPLNIVFEDDYLLVVNKPAGMTVHPGFGNRSGTLVNAVLYHIGLRESIPLSVPDEEEGDEDAIEINESEIFGSDEIRPGLVHRLDKNTSGLLVVSKNPNVHAALAEQFFNHTIARFYNAIVWGIVKNDEGTITGDIGRSPNDRKLFAIVKKGGKYAATDYKVIDRYEFATLLQLKLRTGRTHQIRVHTASIHHPVFGDEFYGGSSIVHGGNVVTYRKKAEKCLKIATRQMLHARTLGFVHPITKETLLFDSDLPDDMKIVNEIMSNY
jgi:23S rRNA pseudouridine1911/1915/1917 synthase